MTSYSSIDAARIVGISYRQIDYWERTRVVTPSVQTADGPGSRRRWSHDDLFRLRIIRALSESGVKSLGAAGRLVRDVTVATHGSHIVLGVNGYWWLVAEHEVGAAFASHDEPTVLGVLPLSTIRGALNAAMDRNRRAA